MAAAAEQVERRVSFGLLAGILLFPLIFVWLTLRKGHSTRSRVLAFLWLILSFLISIIFTVYESTKSSEYVDPWADIVTMDVKFRGSECKDSTPIAVTIINNSNVDILRYHWKISVKAKGHSSELVGMDGHGESDAILEPGYQVTFCQEIPQLTDNQYPIEELEFRPGIVWVEDPKNPS